MLCRKAGYRRWVPHWRLQPGSTTNWSVLCCIILSSSSFYKSILNSNTIDTALLQAYINGLKSYSVCINQYITDIGGLPVPAHFLQGINKHATSAAISVSTNECMQTGQEEFIAKLTVSTSIVMFHKEVEFSINSDQITLFMVCFDSDAISFSNSI